jgi:LTXXQ motif family protein
MFHFGPKSALPVVFALGLACAAPTVSFAQMKDNPSARGLNDPADARALDDAAQRGMRDDSEDRALLTDARIDLLQAALHLTPEQQKYWPAIESALRARGKFRQARAEAVAERVDQAKKAGLAATIQKRDPVDFLRRRAQAMSARATELNKLADAWQPLYQTLSTEQKRRMAMLAIYTMREMRSRVEDRRIQALDDED